ncbi:DNA-binding CsgD family transcriptional regulator/tetratricopeptide (TPR) repeat protein [Curtobacterium luteum]|uniref:Transcriptional regulator n=1 Tax=Curtobacterium luteum TaxID=33881 RepID=A0A8H9L0Y3_9MICO|nr:LuxR family transcriptional regulator [Curtobacterium luteum]MBM7801893.1 DNA-binding CsgD family transcriptional regulator/tetratricopeptide (TPR) repeat protein [Curtobacterium luteum]NUU51791.1 AAA family ATPase [Curtobacterium luteum]GGK86812.1 transcriptional regulator [Curtobacterium luteum]
MALTGRRLEVDRIATLAMLPRESAMVVVGDPGSGRSSVLDAVAHRVSLPVVRVGVNGSESHWPLAGVTALFTALDDPRATAHIAHLLQAGSTGGQVPERAGLAAAHDFLEAVHTLTLPPTVVLIDDLDRMDVESQELIAFLAGRLAGTALRVVASVRTVPADGPLAALPALRLEPLSEDVALTLARSTAPDDANDGVLAILAQETGGNPGVLREQLASLTRGQLIGTEPLVLPLRPTKTTEAIAATVLDAAAGRDLDVLARLALVPTAKAATWDRDALDDLADAGLVAVRGQHVEVANPLVRSSLYWRTPSRERRAAHTALAEVTADTDARAHAWHRSFVDDVPDAVALLRAARSYVVDGNTTAATSLTERALLVGGGTADEHEALLGVAEVMLANRLLSAAARYLAAIRPFRETTTEVRRLRLQYSVEFLSGDAVHADELLLPVDAGDPVETDAVAGLLATVACFRAEVWELDQARDLLARAEPFLDSASAHTLEITATARELIAAVDGTLPADADLHDGLSAAVLTGMSDAALLLLAHALSIGERYRSARRVFALVLARGPQTPLVWTEAARYLSAENEVRSGNFRQALRAIDVWEAGSAASERFREPSRVIAIAWRHFAEGRSSEALDVLDRCLAQRSTNRLWGATAKLHAFRGRVLLLDGRLEEAAVSLEAADAIGRSLRNPAVLRHLGDLVEAYARLGRIDDARAITARLAADHHSRPSRWGALVLARSLALVADDTTRETARRRALELFQPHDSQYERARTFAALAAVGTATERPRLGAAAAAAYEAAGLRRPLVTPAPSVAMPSFGGSLLRSGPTGSAPQPGTPRSAPDASAALTSLTAEERAVVQKVTEGYRNREIASSLFMSQRTVELRLTQIYRKVGARSRSHLVALLT